MTVFHIIKNDTIRVFFLPSGCFTEIIVANPNSTSTVKFSPCCTLKVTFLFLFVSRAELQQPFVIVYPSLASIFKIMHDCIACCMYSHSDLPCKVRICCDFQWSFSQNQEQQAKLANEVYLLTRFFEKVDS